MATTLAVLLYMGQATANTTASADFDGNGVVEVADFLLFVEAFGSRQGHEKYEAKYDLDGNGVIGIPDFLIFADNFGKTVPVRPAPVFADERTNRALDENTLPSEKVGDPIAVVGLDSLTYRLSGAQADSFAIDASTGQIRTREGVRYDYERQKTYVMYVVVTDQSDSDPDSIVVVITLNDVKEPPSLPPSSFLVVPDDQSLSVHYAQVHDEPGRPPVRGYHAELRKGEEGEWGNRKTIYGRNNTTVYYHRLDVPRYQNPYLINGQLYQVRVRAWNTDGASAWSEPVSGTPKPRPPKPQVVYSVTSPVEFQDDTPDTETSAAISISGSTGQGGMVVVPKAALPDNIKDVAEAVFVEIAQVSNVPEVPPNTGFTILEHSPVYDIVVKARLESGEDIDIGDTLGASVEICLPVPENNSRAVLIHYEGGTWQRLSSQRIEGNTICGFVDTFSLFAVGVSTVSIPAQREVLSVCDRTGAVRDSIVALVPVSTCGDVTAAHLSAIDSLSLRGAGLTALKADDFSGLTGLTKLNLSDNMLSSLPDGLFDDLKALTWLHLAGNPPWSNEAGNQLTSIPSELFTLSNLEVLRLEFNQLSGEIPTELSNLTNLKELRLYYNALSGEIPTELGTLSNLINLYLWNNQLSGEIPTELGNLANLKSLRVGENQLSGSIPSELGNLANLEQLVFNGNALSGEIPSELGNLANLWRLRLDNNQLSGEIPEALGNLTNLLRLQLDENQLSGEIPAELGNLTNLERLELFNNQLSGEIPTELGNLSKLEQCFLHSNQLSGEIPTELGNLSNLISLHLDDNALSGEIPTELGNLHSLISLNLNYNQLSGMIPTELGNLASLTHLSLGGNQLSGEIPTELGNLSNLEFLRLQDNASLMGALPQSLTGLTKLATFYFGGTGLCAPLDAAFQAWLEGIAEISGSNCSE